MKVRVSKSLISLILCLLMMISMVTVGVVTASSATEDTAETGGSGTVTVYFENVRSWSNVYVCFLNGDTWNSSGASTTGYTFNQMTLESGKTYKYTYTGNYSQYIVFCKDKQDGYGNLWQTEASYRGDFDPANPYFTPNATANGTYNSCTYYNDGSWAAAPTYTYSLTVGNSSVDVTSGSAIINNVPAGSQIYFVLRKQGSASTQVKKGAYTFPAAGTYKVTFNVSDYSCTFAPVQKIRIAIGDDTGDRWLGNDDARFTVTINGKTTKMTKSVDVASGLKVWYAEVDDIAAGTALTFKRSSAINGNDVWNTWTINYAADTPLYKIGDNDAITTSTMLDIPDGSVTNFGYGIWVDTKGNADTKDFVKIYANDFVKDTKYTLYLPAYTDWTQLKVYTNFPTLTINGQAVTKGQVNTLNLSRSGIENTVNISFKRNASGSTHYGTLHIMRGGTASAMLLSTNDELYTGLTAAYADNGDGTANYAGVAAYKSLISTKGKYVFYTKDGEKLNTDDGLKKLKPRGNSTFEASMRLYGKTAYNITLNEKAPLIEGCESSKKYSLLANNADESLMRNLTVYGIADEVGMPYTPNTRLIDLYDNGTYLGAYVLTEKVEYGKSTLIPEAKSSDKLNEDILAAGKGIDYDGLKQVTGTYTAKSGTVYQYQYSVASEAGKTYDFDGSTVTIGEGEEAETYTLDEALMKKYDFLIEHEINGRYQPEATWFVSGRTKQAVVPKYPEFATQKQAQWMIETYDALETAAYGNDYDGVAAVADVESFASVYLIQELTENLDAGATSYYILGGKNYPKLLAAPLWDYDWAAGMYNGKKLTYNGEVDVADYSKKFVTEKSVKIAADDGRPQGTRNLQAQLTTIPEFWTVCKTVYTNKFSPVINSYLGDGKTLLGTNLPNFRTAAAMNEDRWNVLHKMNENPDNYWGTRSTTQYKKGSYSFAIGGNKCTGATFNYDNTVYYLNDWLTKRNEFMYKSTTNGGLGLYDPSLIVQPTEPESNTYIVGDADGDGEVGIMDATAIQRKLASYAVNSYDELAADANENGFVDILDATAIQRKLADYNDGYAIGTEKDR